MMQLHLSIVFLQKVRREIIGFYSIIYLLKKAFDQITTEKNQIKNV